MTDKLTTTNQHYNLVLTTQAPLDRNPAAVYLASRSESGRRTQRMALYKIAVMLTGSDVDALTCIWGAVRYQHAAVIRTRLAET